MCKYDYVVDKSGNGTHTTLSDALAEVHRKMEGVTEEEVQILIRADNVEEED